MYRFVYCIYIYIYIYIVYIESAAKLTLCGCLRSLVRSVKTALAYNKTQVFIRSHLCYLLTQVNCKFISKFSLHLFLLHSKKKKNRNLHELHCFARRLLVKRNYSPAKEKLILKAYCSWSQMTHTRKRFEQLKLPLFWWTAMVTVKVGRFKERLWHQVQGEYITWVKYCFLWKVLKFSVAAEICTFLMHA